MVLPAPGRYNGVLLNLILLGSGVKMVNAEEQGISVISVHQMIWSRSPKGTDRNVELKLRHRVGRGADQ